MPCYVWIECNKVYIYIRDISFPIFTRKEIVTKRIIKEIKTIVSRLNDLSSFLSNIEQNRN